MYFNWSAIASAIASVVTGKTLFNQIVKKAIAKAIALQFTHLVFVSKYKSQFIV